jgi:hypothetical protein
VNDRIARAAAAAEAVSNTDQNERLTQLEGRVALLEPLLEAKEQDQKFNEVFSRYVKDFTDEQAFLKSARWAFGALACVLVCALFGLLALSIFHPASPLLKAPPASIALFIVGIFSATALVLNGALKAILRSASERHSEGFLPPQIDEALKLHDRLNGKG